MSLGVLRVAAVLEQAGHKVEVLDLSGVENFEDAVSSYCQGMNPAEVFGITSTSPQLPAAVKVVDRLRSELGRGIRVILGGPHVTLVNAAAKKGVPRACRAFGKLLDSFDVLVAGDGEVAIHQAIKSSWPRLVDADDPKSSMFLTNQMLSEIPFPARHLVDVSSYHYKIDGADATSLIAQLGCLDPNTPVLLSSGIELPISDVKKGDRVVCFDTEKNEVTTAPVEATWEREADDLWELTWEDGTHLRVTGEHPIWTPRGWVSVEKLNEGDLCLRSVRESENGISDGENISCNEILHAPMLRRFSENPCEPEMVACGTEKDAGEVVRHDSRRARREFQYQGSPLRRKNPSRQENIFRNKIGKPKPDEETRGCRESFGHNQKEMGVVLFQADDKALEGRETWTAQAETAEYPSKQIRTNPNGDIEGESPAIQLRREWSVLDRPVQVREKTESRFHRHRAQESHTSSWGILAQRVFGHNRERGLREQGMESSRGVVQGIEEEGKKEPNPKARLIWEKVTSKVFIGNGRVCNLTIHPIHTYFANGMLVHNCPFGCGFCGGRMSPSLRKIRMRSIESILSEMEHLHKSYGFTGFMFYDDELNVNTKMVPMMEAIAELAEDLGVEFKLRGFVKAELFNEQQAAAMYKAGFRWILTGFESGSPRILKNIQKKATQEENSRAVDIAHSHGIKVKALMSIGHPGESKESVKETKDWLLEVKPEDFDVTIITTYPGTPYYDGAVASGDEWRYEINGDALYATEVDYTKVCDYYKGDPNDGYVSYVRTDFLTAEELVEERKNVESSVRETLGIPFNPSVAAQRYEHSMGQLPNNILKGDV